MGHSKWLRVDIPEGVESLQLGKHKFGFEVGAEFVHGSTTVLNDLLLDRGFRLKELFTWAHGDGGVSAKPAPDGGIGMYWLGKEKRLLRYDDQDEDLKHMVATLWSLADRSEGATASDPRSLLQALKEAGVAERVLGMAESGYANTVGGTLQKIGFARMCQCERNWNDEGEGDFRVEGTLGETAVPALAEDLTIHNSCPVTQIRRVPSGGAEGKARTDTGGWVEVKIAGGRTMTAAAVVVTVPVPVLQRKIIEFSPPLPPAKVRAFSSMECEPGVKVMAKFSELIWPETLHGMICSDSFAPELWFDKYEGGNPNNKNEGATFYYCTAFFTSDQARRVSTLSTTEVFTSLLDQISEMFRVKAQEKYCGGFVCDWGKVPYIWGAYTMPAIRELADARQLLSMPVDGVMFFAGEATDPYSFMTAHAAMATGQRAAHEAMQAVVNRRMQDVLSLHATATFDLKARL